MLIKSAPDIRSHEITPEHRYLNRRSFLRGAAGLGALTLGGLGSASGSSPVAAQAPLEGFEKSPFSTDEKLNSFEEITTYNNFYEFGTDKGDPARHAGQLTTKPWSVKVEGHCNKPAEYALEDLVEPHTLEERIYRLRCVEAWSMVIPWIGIPLGRVLERFEPTSKARFVAFTTLHRPQEMPGQRS